jgi:hypothetical protein
MPVAFASDILPLFRPNDIACMQDFGVSLGDYAYMSDPAGDDKFPDHANARDVLAHLTGASTPRMPMGGPFWSPEWISMLEQWITDGSLP